MICGDAGYSVPNILSSEDVLVTGGKRQKPVTKKKLEAWRGKKPEEFCTEDMLRNYYRNKAMVDLSETPESIRINIINQFKEQVPRQNGLMSYFVEKRLKNLMEHIEDF